MDLKRRTMLFGVPANCGRSPATEVAAPSQLCEALKKLLAGLLR